MDRETSQLLRQFLLTQKALQERDVISSRDYIGDIGRYLCRLTYGLEVPRGRRPAAYDGRIGSSRVAVRINNCPVGTPVRVMEPLGFDELIVVLGPNCLLRPEGVASDFVFYRLSPDQVRERFEATDGGYVAGRGAFNRSYDKVLNLTSG